MSAETKPTTHETKHITEKPRKEITIRNIPLINPRQKRALAVPNPLIPTRQDAALIFPSLPGEQEDGAEN